MKNKILTMLKCLYGVFNVLNTQQKQVVIVMVKDLTVNERA